MEPFMKIRVPLGGSAMRGSIVCYDVGDWSDRKRFNCKSCLVLFFPLSKKKKKKREKRKEPAVHLGQVSLK